MQKFVIKIVGGIKFKIRINLKIVQKVCPLANILL